MISRAIALARAMSEPTSRPEPQVGPLGAGRPPRVDRDQPGTPAHPLQEVVEEDRMRLPGVAAPQEEEVRLLGFTI